MKRNTLPVLHLILLLLLIGFAGFLFYVTARQLELTNRFQAEVDQIVANQSRLSDLAVSLPSLTGETGAWSKTLPVTEKDVAAFAVQIEQLAKTQGLVSSLDLEDFPGPIDVSGRYLTGLGVDITLEGSYQGVTNFVFALGNLPYFYKIDKLTLTKQETRLGVKAILNGALIMNLNE